MKIVEEKFNTRFARWEIVLPTEDFAQRMHGKILKGGWAIWYLFGSDENGEYLDYYAEHRMGGEHCRIYVNGEKQSLPTMQEVFRVTGDSVADTKEKEAFFKHNQGVSKLLVNKGFGIEGDEPLGVQISHLLRDSMA
jgi:hypothetical protein